MPPPTVSSLDYECWICGAPAGKPCFEDAAPDGMREGSHIERGASCACGAMLPAGSSECLRCASVALLREDV